MESLSDHLLFPYMRFFIQKAHFLCPFKTIVCTQKHDACGLFEGALTAGTFATNDQQIVLSGLY